MPRVGAHAPVLRKGVVFTLLFAGVVTPAAANPLLMFLLGIARDIVEAQVTRSRNAPAVPECCSPPSTRGRECS